MILVLVGLTILVHLIGFLYQPIAEARDMQRHPPPGEMVDIGGYRLHLYCTGEKQADRPTVILEAGSDAWSSHWLLVQQQAADQYYVCAYDRPGHGWSDAAPKDTPRDAVQMADELHMLLANTGTDGPYVLVAHSLGALISLVYTDRYPGEVAGMVLLDARHPDYISSAPPGLAEHLNQRGLLWVYVLGARTGMMRLAPESMFMLDTYADLPEDLRAGVKLGAVRPSLWIEQAGPWDAIVDEQAREVTSLGDMPLVVVRHGQPMFGPEIPVPDELAEVAEAHWVALHEDLASLSTRGVVLVAEASGHRISEQQPEIVVTAIEQVLQALQP